MLARFSENMSTQVMNSKNQSAQYVRLLKSLDVFLQDCGMKYLLTTGTLLLKIDVVAAPWVAF